MAFSSLRCEAIRSQTYFLFDKVVILGIFDLTILTTLEGVVDGERPYDMQSLWGHDGLREDSLGN